MSMEQYKYQTTNKNKLTFILWKFWMFLLISVLTWSNLSIYLSIYLLYSGLYHVTSVIEEV